MREDCSRRPASQTKAHGSKEEEGNGVVGAGQEYQKADLIMLMLLNVTFAFHTFTY